MGVQPGHPNVGVSAPAFVGERLSTGQPHHLHDATMQQRLSQTLERDGLESRCLPQAFEEPPVGSHRHESTLFVPGTIQSPLEALPAARWTRVRIGYAPRLRLGREPRLGHLPAARSSRRCFNPRLQSSGLESIRGLQEIAGCRR